MTQSTENKPASGKGVHFHEVVTNLRGVDRGLLKAAAEKYNFYSVTAFLTFESREAKGGNVRGTLRFYTKNKAESDGNGLYKYLSEHGFPDLETQGWRTDDQEPWFGVEVRS